MASLTTLFVVGPEEYVEFSESMGSKAFLEHIWDQEKTPLKVEETSAFGTQLHSAGARLSPTPPPRIEFPTVLRVRGRGNKYRLSGKYISWEELKKRNPSAVKDPPSLEEFVNRGSTVGTAERLEPGSFLKGEKRFKINKKPQAAGMSLQKDSDGWIGGGGASDSVFANKGSMESIYAVKPAQEDKPSSKGDNTAGVKADTLSPEPVAPQPKTLRKSRSGLSLYERLGMDRSKEEPPALPPMGTATDKAPGKVPLPPKGPTLATHLQPPLSASCTPPETPLKGPKAKLRQPVVTPTEAGSPKVTMDLPPTKSGLQLEGAPSSTTRTMPSSTSRAARSQIDDMLLKVRQARTTISSGGGSSESMWAPKEEEVKTVETKESTRPAVTDAAPSVSKSAVKKSSDKDDVRSGERPQDKVTPSLLSRLGPPTAVADEPSTTTAKPSGGTSERKIERSTHSSSAAPSSDRKAKELEPIESYKRAPVGDEVSNVSDGATGATLKAENSEKVPQESSDCGKDEDVPHGVTASAPSSSSLSSIPSERKSEDLQTSADSKSTGVDAWSTVGNDTLTSIDWADLDDDDDSPLDVPDDWGYGDLKVFSNPASQKSPDPINVAQSNSSVQKRIATAADPPRQPRGMRGGQTRRPSDGGGKLAADISSLPYWQRRSAPHGNTAKNEQRPTSKDFGGLKIAGAAANAHSKGGKKKKDPPQRHEQPKKELFPQHQDRRESNAARQQPPHRGKQPMVLPPNATPLQPAAASASSKSPQERPRPSAAATKSEGAFARMTKDVIGVGAKDDPSARSRDLASRINLSSGTSPSATNESKKKSKGGVRGGRRPSQA